MCLGIPGRIIAIADSGRQLGIVAICGAQREVNLACVLDPADPVDSCIGQWVMVHVGFALSLINAPETPDFGSAHALATQIGRLARPLAAARGRPIRVMEVCGGHTHTIFRHGLKHMLPPDTVEFVHGPSCPVSVLPPGRIDAAVALARRSNVVLATFDDALRVPGSRSSLAQAKAEGADVRTVYSPLQALQLARENPDSEVVFLAVGFESTMPGTALTILEAERETVRNFSVLCNHVANIPGIQAVLARPQQTLDGLLGPGHVSMVVGTGVYQFVATRYRKPMVVAGFEPLDILHSLRMVLRQLAEGRCEIENQYGRVVRDRGNERAVAAIATVFELRERFEWRGLGLLDHGGFRMRPSFAAHDAERKFALSDTSVAEPQSRSCGEVLKGALAPYQCKLFGTACTPERPLGGLMVTTEGACAAHYQYGGIGLERRELFRTEGSATEAIA